MVKGSSGLQLVGKYGVVIGKVVEDVEFVEA